MSWSQQDLSFKKLSNKRVTTSTGKGLPEEKGASTLELYLPDIITELIPGTGNTATGLNGVLYYYGPSASFGQTLVVDTSVPGNLTWFASSGYGNTTTANDGSAGSESLRLFNWVSDKYDAFGTVSGAGYEIKLYDNAGNLITKSDASNWLFDYQTGILLFNGATLSNGNPVSTSGPYKIVGWRYVGQKGTIPAYFGGSGYTTYTKGDILVGAGGTFIKFNVGSDNYVLSADSSTSSGLKWVVNTGSGGSGISYLNNLTAGVQYFAVGTSGSLFNISSIGSTHTFNIPIAGSGATGLVSTDAQTFAGQKTFTSAIIGDLTGTATTAGFATTANYSNQSGYAITSGLATTATYAHQSGYGITAGLATTATYAHQSGYAITSGSSSTANTATYSHQSGYATTAGLATTSTYSHQSGYAITSGSSDTSGLATTATYAHQSGYAITSGSSSTATTATYAHQSGYAITSGSSNTSGYATTSGLATTSQNINIVSANTGTFYPLFTSNSSTSSGVAVSIDGSDISYNFATNTLTAGAFSGNVSATAVTATNFYGTFVGNLSGSATTSQNVNIVSATTGIFYPLFSNTSSTASGIGISVDNAISYDASTDTLTAGKFSGLASGTAATFTNFYGTLTGIATTATNVNSVSTTASNATHFLMFSPVNGGSGVALSSGVGITFNPSSGQLGLGTGSALINGLLLGTSANTITTASGNLTLNASGGTVLVGGNLNVQGTATYIDSTTQTITDPVIVLGSGAGGTHTNVTDTQDRGIEFRRFSGSAITGFFGLSNASGRFTFIPNANVTANNTYAGSIGVIEANITGSAITATNFYGTFVGNSASATTAGLATTAQNLNITTTSTGTLYPLFTSVSTTASGVAVSVDGTDISYDAATNTLTAGKFSGLASGTAATFTNFYGPLTGTATTAQNLNVVSSTTGTFYPLFTNISSSASGVAVSVDSGISWDSATDTLTAGKFSGLASGSAATFTNFYGTLTGNVTGTSTTSQNVNIVSATTGTFYPLFSNVSSTASGVAISVDSGLSWNAATDTLTSGTFSGNLSATAATATNFYGTFVGSATTATNINIVAAATNASHRVLFTPTSGSASGVAVSTENSFVYNPSTDILSVSGLAVTATTSSTNSSTGALIVTGGVGIGGTVYTATDLNVGTSTTGRLYFSQATLGSAGTTVIPSMAFIGTTNSPITLSVLADNSLSFDGSSGQLFSINNNLSTGWIFAVNDISGLPLIRANADGTVAMGEFAGNIGIGISNPSYKLHVVGDTNLSSTYVYRINGTSVLSASSLGTGVTNSSLTAVGTITTGTWAGSTITGLYGGTGYTNYTSGDILVGAGGTFIKLNAGSSNYVLTSNGTGTIPSWQAVPPSAASSVAVSPTTTNSSFSITAVNSANGSGLGLSTIASFVVNPSTGIVSMSGLAITASTTSTSSSTGALIVTGGVGIGQTLFTSSSYASSISGVVLNNGVITTGTWSATAITALYGGTGLVPTFTVGDILYANTSTTWGRLPASSNAGDILVSSGSGATPTYVSPATLSVGFASTATYAYQSGYGITSGFATTANYAYQSGYGITSGFATTAANLNVSNASTGVFYPVLSNTASSASGVGASVNSFFSFNAANGAFGATSVNIFAGQSYSVGGNSVLSSSSLGTGVTNSSLTALGTITTGVWAGTSISAFYGGTGYNSYTKGDILVGAGNTFIKLNVGTDNYVLTASSLSSTGLTWSPTAATGLTTLNGLNSGVQYLAFGYSGTVPAFSSSGSTHTLNIPLAGTGSTGLVSTQAQSFAGIKTFTNAVSITDNTGSGSYTAGALVVTGGVGIGGTLNVQGDFNVQGTFTTINSTTVIVADKNIELGVVATPTDLTAQGGGITLRGASDKTINWYSGVGWSSSENFNLAFGNTFKINDTTVLSSSSLGTGVTNSSLTALGTITTGVWSATAITALYGGTGLVPAFTVGDILYANTSSTWGRLTANSNSGYLLASAGSGSTPAYVNPSLLSVGFASTASYAYQSGYAITAGFATTSNYAYQSGYGITAGTATTAGFATTAGYATTSGLATTADYAHQSGYAITSGLATTATYSHQSGYGITSGFATTAANLNVSNASTGTFYPVLSNTASSTSGIGASVNSFFSFNAATGAFGATSVNILTDQAYSIGGNNVLFATSLGTGVTNSSLTALGTITTGTWAGSIITGLYGGTGYSTYTKGDLLVGAGSTFIKLAVGTDNYILSASSASAIGLTWIANTGGGGAGTVYNGSLNAIPYYPAAGTAITGSTSFTNTGTSINIGYSTATTNTATGALTVVGGVGIGQTLFTSSSYASSISGVVLNNGIITSGTWAGSTITGFYGGTGYNSYNNGDILVGAGSTFIKVGSGSTNYVLSSNPMYPAGVGWTWVSAVGVGTNPPYETHDSDLWWNSNDGSLNFYYNDGDTSQWVEIAGGSGIDLSNDVHITSTTGSTNSSTGALIVDGGVGIAGTVNAQSFVVNGTYDHIGTTLITSATTVNQVALTLNTSVYRSAKIFVQASSGSTYHSQEIMMLHDDSNVYMTEYAIVNSGAIGSTFDGDISGGNMRFLVTPTYAVTTYKIACSAMRI